MNQTSVEWLLPFASASLKDLQQSNLASVRLRAAVCLQAIVSQHWRTAINDGQQPSGASTIVVGKLDFINDTRRPERWLRHLESARKRGACIVIDYTDHHLETGTAADRFYAAALDLADLAICSSTKLAQLIRPFYAGQIAIIEDPIEVPITQPVAHHRKLRTALWVGHSTNLPYLIEFLFNDFALSTPMRLIAMTNAYPLPKEYTRLLEGQNLSQLEICVVPWNLPDMITAASVSDVCWIPAGLNSKRKSGASSNRLLTALALGLPVAADELESYLPMRRYFASLHTPEFAALMHEPETHFAQVLEAQALIARDYTKAAIGRQWLNLLGKRQDQSQAAPNVYGKEEAIYD
jgi:hypothetical protein